MKPNLKILRKAKRTFSLSGALIFFFKQKYIPFLEMYFFKNPKNSIVSAFFY